MFIINILFNVITINYNISNKLTMCELLCLFVYILCI